MAVNRPEQALQKSIVEWADVAPFPETTWRDNRWLMPPVKIGHYLHHTPNGGGRSKAEGGIFKAMGVRAGYPDLSLDIALNSGEEIYAGLRVELKVGNNKLAPNQRLWQERLVRAGYVFTEARSLEEFELTVYRYLNLGRPVYRSIMDVDPIREAHQDPNQQMWPHG